MIEKEDFLIRRKEKLTKEKEAIEELLDDSEKRTDDWIKGTEDILNFAERAKEEFDKGGIYKKKEIFLTLGSNLSLKDQELLIQGKNYYV